MKTRFVVREAVAGLSRNATMTVAMIITTAISLALLATGVLITTMTNETKDIYLDRIEVMIQFDGDVSANDHDCSSDECRAVKEKLESDGGVERVTFRNREQSFDRFRQLFGQSDPQLVAQTSPDALPAALHVRLADPLTTGPVDAVRDMPGVATVVDQGDDLRGATRNLDAIRNASFIVAAIQAVAAIFLIMNMVQIAAFTRRHEISIMRMVGASRWYTQAPFVLEAIVASVIGSVIAVAGMFLGKVFVLDRALRALYDSNLIARITSADIWLVSPVIVVVGAVVAAVTAQITLRWYVKR
ncbi:permease-like cell division protein FtsX [Corynebacterium bovis]|uniref:Cell division protein FtsX n=2 Tax=Corynebacterium bovis TaxID=36808 RepID=A0A3R8R6X9_9CORY|nr:permease-like cell division protein FtsX [Corynebacterium bovis]MBB3115300.1 cell division transport system permease protein [Corynebacterium bovis DSM 20582 = CIP 54.80]MDK8511099.1 permease-like cell division protein FtsX [Corynebacterium bovis]MDN8578983.1 permease-like cell division protein FtsX [Corynebacterium bovis]QQC48194.1 ABC transporter permease [Corynebacterium bovis]RRO81605.1 ABC transporter permease [Corynebacterium bovis]